MIKTHRNVNDPAVSIGYAGVGAVTLRKFGSENLTLGDIHDGLQCLIPIVAVWSEFCHEIFAARAGGPSFDAGGMERRWYRGALKRLQDSCAREDFWKEWRPERVCSGILPYRVKADKGIRCKVRI